MPKYILQISLVLLMTTVWATADDEASESAIVESAKEQSSLPTFFRWGQVGSDFVELTWSVEDLGKDYADIIKLTALGITISFAGMNFSYFLSGHLVLTHLFSGNTYRMDLEALKGEHDVLSYSEEVKTKPFE
ncbi:Oncosphere antigen B [Taenia solium]|eukprot:TsM_000778800 transcript=TsM_000778800 gene=TsM_000778800